MAKADLTVIIDNETGRAEFDIDDDDGGCDKIEQVMDAVLRGLGVEPADRVEDKEPRPAQAEYVRQRKKQKA